MMQPFRPGDRLIDHAAPIGEVMQQLQTQLAEYRALKQHLAGGGISGITGAPVSFSDSVGQAADGAASDASSSSSSLLQLAARSDSPRPPEIQSRDTHL